MGIYANLIGDVPGQPEGILASATTVRDLADALQTDYDDAWAAKELPEIWEGEAAEAYNTVIYDQSVQISDLEEGVRRASGALEDYGWVVRTEQQRCDGIRDRMLELDAVVETATGLVEMIRAHLQVMPEVAEHQQAYVESVTTVRQAAVTCAALLAEGAHVEVYNYNDQGQDLGARTDLRQDQMEEIASDLENGRIYPDDINQRGIGDCYLLAALSSMARTSEGREHISGMVKPHYENGELTGFMVTLPRDPNDPHSGEGRTVFVDETYVHGSTGTSADANVFSVIEAAYGQVYPAGTLPENSDGNGLTGGRPDDSLEELTDTDSEVVHRKRGVFGWGAGYDDAQREQITAATEEGRPVVAATAGIPDEERKEGVGIVTVTIDGEEQQIEMVGTHAYEVVSSDENGVTLRNPWGYNNPGSGTTPMGATFTISWEDFEDYSSDVSIGGGYSS